MAHTSTFRIQVKGSYPDRLVGEMKSSPCYPQTTTHFAIYEGGITDVTDDSYDIIPSQEKEYDNKL
jgi:hypothetical protein